MRKTVTLTPLTAPPQSRPGRWLVLALLLLVAPGVAQAQTLTFTLQASSPSTGTNSGPHSMAVADVNGDGKPDALTANYNTSTLGVLLGNGNGGFTLQANSPSTGAGSNPYSVAVADVNGDGKLDALTANNSTSTLGVLLGDGNGGFTLQANSPSTGASSVPRSVAVADVNGDNKLDAVVANYGTSTLGVLLGDGNGGFTLQASSPSTGASTNPYSVAVADVNGDGRPDALTANNSTSTVAVLLGNGNGGFTLQANSPSTGASSGPLALTTADVNGDSRLDVLVTNQRVGTLGVLLGTGNGGFTLQANSPNIGPSSGPLALTTADVNGDGKLDVLTANAAGNTLGVLLGDGNGGFVLQSSPSTGASSGPYSVAVADVNGDGKLDALAANYSTRTLGVLLNTTVLPPTITNFLPASGPAGTLVTITGTNLDGVRSVRFGTGGLALFTNQTFNSLTVRVPVNAATGRLTLTPVMGAAVVSGTAFTYAPTPVGLTATLAPAGPLDVCQPRTLTATAALAALTNGSFDGAVNSVAVQTDGKILAGGVFSQYGGTTSSRIVRLNPDGSRDASFVTGAGFDGDVNSVAVQADGKVLVGGNFTSYNNTPGLNRLVRLNADGSLDTSLATGVGFANGAVLSVAVQADGKVLVGGNFTSYNGTTLNRLVRLNADGSRDFSFSIGVGFNGQVRTLAVMADGKILVGGDFTRYRNVTGINRLVRLNDTGGRDATFGTGFDASVSSLAVQADGKVLVGGNFTSYNNTTGLNRLVRLNTDDTRDTDFITGTGFDAYVSSLVVQANGKVLVGGDFTSYNNTTGQNRLVQLNADGTRDTGFSAGTNFDLQVSTVAVQTDGRVLVGGLFADYFLRLNPSGSRNDTATPVSGASFSFSPSGSTTNPLVTSTAASYSVTASLGGVTSAASNTVVLTACPVPFLASLSAPNGVVGSSLTLTGSNLTDATAVTFAGTANNTVTTSLTVSGTGSSQTITVTVPSGAQTGNVTVTTPNGTSNPQAFTVTIPTPQDLTISTGTTAAPVAIAAGTYNNLTITGTGVATLNGVVTVNGTLTVQTGGTLNTSCQPLTGPGSFVLQAGATLGICDAAGIAATGATGAVQLSGTRSFSPNAAYVYNGTGAQANGPALPATVARLTLANAAGLSLSQPLTIASALTLTSGVLTAGTGRLTLAPTATISESETSYVVGTVAVSRTLAPGGSETFGGLGLRLSPAAGSVAPGTTLVTRTTGTALAGAGTSQSILRSFDIQTTVNTGLNVAMDFTYFLHELNGIAPANLRLFKSETGTAPWVPQPGATLAPNLVSKAGITDFSVWTLGSAAAPLPVELSAFTATATGTRTVRLAWATASEKNSRQFDVERSLDGTRFERLGTVAAAGNSSSTRSYDFTDNQVPKTPGSQVPLYYRLRQVDADGTFAFSPVRLVALAGDAPAELALFPNPTTGAATLRGAAPGAAVTVFDGLGRPVLTATADAEGQARLQLPAGTPVGVYVVRCGTRARRLMVR